MAQRVGSPGVRDSRALSGLAEVPAHLLGRVRRRAIPHAVLLPLREQLDVLHPSPQKEAATPQDLPHAVGGAGPRGVLFRLRVGAERDGGALDHLGESSAVDGTAGDRQLGRRLAPTRAADLQPRHRANRPEHRIAMRILARSDEADIALIFGPRGGGRKVGFGIHALRKKPNPGHTGGAKRRDLGQARGVHSSSQPSQSQRLGPGLQIEIPEGAGSPLQQRLQRGLAQPDGVPGQQDEIGLEAVRQITHRPVADRSGVPHPSDGVHQTARVPQRANRSLDRRFGLVSSAGSEDDHSHAPSIARH